MHSPRWIASTAASNALAAPSVIRATGIWPGVLDDVLQQRRVPQRLLGEVAHQPAVLVEEPAQRHRVEVADVVHRDDAAAGGRDLLAVDPVVLGGEQQRRLHDGDHRRPRPATLLLQLADLRHRRLPFSLSSAREPTAPPAPGDATTAWAPSGGVAAAERGSGRCRTRSPCWCR